MPRATLLVNVLTGSLGAGKTALLNQRLSQSHGDRYAVIVNEFSEICADNHLVVTVNEEVFEMNNGCIYCSVCSGLICIIFSAHDTTRLNDKRKLLEGTNS